MIDIKEDLEPRIKYVVDEIAEMKIFDKDRVQLLLMLSFSDIVSQLFYGKGAELRGQNINNQREIQYGNLKPAEKQLLQAQNELNAQKIKAFNRLATTASDIRGYAELKVLLRKKLGKQGFTDLMEESRNIKL